MSAFMDTLGITKQGKITWVAKKLLTTLLLILAVVLVTTVDYLIIGQSVSARWLPLVGLVLGVGLACLIFREITFLRNLGRRSPADGKGIGTDKEKKKNRSDLSKVGILSRISVFLCAQFNSFGL